VHLLESLDTVQKVATTDYTCNFEKLLRNAANRSSDFAKLVNLKIPTLLLIA
jgi:hypothetical protein